jgi:hypothetical protein
MSMDFASRPPSTAWEPVEVPGIPGCQVWLWRQPGGNPLSLLIQIPPQAHQQAAGGLTMRRLMHAAGLAAEQVAGWTLGGVPYPSQYGRNPLLDHPLPPSPPEGVTATVDVLPLAGAMPAPAAAVLMGAAPSANLVEAIDTNWQAVLQIERQLEAARKQLGAMQGRLQSLNRDLGPEERRFADNADKKDWQDVRRWLRDAAAHVSRFIRDHDIGAVSGAGRRNRLEELHQQIVGMRQPTPGLEGIALEFEQHRKTAQSLLTQMQSVQSSASRDAEQRAQQVLGRIASKVRSSRAKR